MRVRPDRWLWGMPILGALWVAATLAVEPRLASDLTAQSGAIVAPTADGSSEPWLEVSVRGRDVVASGEAPTGEARAQALARLQDLRGARRIDDLVGTIASPSRFSLEAAREGGAIRLAGFRPVEVGRTAFAARVRRDLPGGVALEDRTRPGIGAPEGFMEVVAMVVGQIARLATGSATVADRRVAVRGEAADRETYDGVRAAFGGLPFGYTADPIDIEPPVQLPFVWSAERRAEDGAMVLDGYVPSEKLRAEVSAAAERVAPGLVIDRLQAARGLAAGIDFATVARFALAGLEQMQEGRASLRDGRFDLVGAAIKGVLPNLLRAIETGLPRGLVRGAVELRPATVDPYTFTARRTADSIVLEGYYPDERTRDSVLGLVRPRFFGEAIIDRGRLADGAPRDFLLGVGAAVEQLSFLASGEASLRGASLSLRGESLYSQTAERMRATLASAAPPGWKVEADIRQAGASPASAKP